VPLLRGHLGEEGPGRQLGTGELLLAPVDQHVDGDVGSRRANPQRATGQPVDQPELLEHGQRLMDLTPVAVQGSRQVSGLGLAARQELAVHDLVVLPDPERFEHRVILASRRSGSRGRFRTCRRTVHFFRIGRRPAGRAGVTVTL
jgi:hypothetical protein